LYFTPVDDAHVYRVDDQAALTLTAFYVATGEIV
jgi:hypothetical protein